MTTPPDLNGDGVPAGAVFQPKRATLALDAHHFPDGTPLEGPKVDRAVGTWEGNPDGDVDAWELGRAVPTRAQVRLLAALTHQPVAFFYVPVDPAEEAGTMWVCGRSGPKGMGRTVCQQVSTRIVAPAAGDPPHRQGTLF